MKKSIFVFLLVILITLAKPNTAQAGIETASSVSFTNTTLNLPRPTLLPDSPLYFLERWWESTRLLFTFNKNQKVKVLSQIDHLRLEEINALIDEGKSSQTKSLVADFLQTKKEIDQLIQSSTNEINKDTSDQILADNLSDVSILKLVEEKTPDLSIKFSFNQVSDTLEQTAQAAIENRDYPDTDNQPNTNTKLEAQTETTEQPVVPPETNLDKDVAKHSADETRSQTQTDDSANSGGVDTNNPTPIDNDQLYEATSSAQPSVEGILTSTQYLSWWQKFLNFVANLLP